MNTTNFISIEQAEYEYQLAVDTLYLKKAALEFAKANDAFVCKYNRVVEEMDVDDYGYGYEEKEVVDDYGYEEKEVVDSSSDDYGCGYEESKNDATMKMPEFNKGRPAKCRRIA